MNPKTSTSHPIRVDFLKSKEFPVLNRLGLTFAPGKKQKGAITGNWDRDLKSDIETLRNKYKVDTLISLVEDFELEELKITNLVEVCLDNGLDIIRFPIPDGSVPELDEDFEDLTMEIRARLEAGETVVIHCKGGLGRAGTLASCIVLEASDVEIEPDEAIRLVLEARPGAVENELQEAFIEDFACVSNTSHFLIYLNELDVFELVGRGEPLRLLPGNDFSEVFTGDTLWVVSLINGRELALAGRLIVESFVDSKDAAKVLRGLDLPKDQSYAFAEDDKVEPLRPVPIDSIAAELRFLGPVNSFEMVGGVVGMDELESILKLDRESAELLEEIWDEVSQFAGEDDAAEADVAQCLQNVFENPNDFLAHYDLGIAYAENEMFTEAIESLETSVRLAPDEVDALYMLGQLYLDVDRIDDAIDALNKCILNDYEFAFAHFLLGVAFTDCGRDKEAVESIKNGLVYEPNDKPAHYALGRAYFNLGEYEAAIEEFKDQPAKVEPEYWIGKCHRELGDHESEIKYYRIAIDDDRRSPNLMFALGVAHARLYGGKAATGIAYREFEYFDPEDPEIVFYLGLFHLAIGEMEQVSEIAQFLKRMDPASAKNLRTLSKVS